MKTLIALTLSALTLTGTDAATSGSSAARVGDATIDQQRASVRVVTSLPVYAAITQAIGGSEVQVVSIADPNEDSHFVRPKPSFALELRRADMFVTTGLDLELWVPALLDKAGNADVMEG
ncbi:MAG: metal ABC transporter substrate-binding protein, partial [Longimicrobiales bacterium]|nr:metal ABC transporter substrate-binding protein [Longimicrobiales bacterium]